MVKKFWGKSGQEQWVIRRTDNDTQNQDRMTSHSEAGRWHGDICQGIIMAYFLVMTVIYPFYAPGGYARIGEVKYAFFRNISLVTLAVMAAVIILSVLMRRDWEWVVRSYRQMSVTGWFAYGYFAVVLLSYLCSTYKRDALWGAEGWYMGAVTQIMFVLLYFFFSRYFQYNLKWIGLWLLAASCVFVLGICNSYSFYPIQMEGQGEGFISTLGNINWFCGYWSVTATLGMILYWCSKNRKIRFFTGIYSVIAMVAGITQGSSSAYLVFIVLLLTLCILSFQDNRRFYRFLELCMMFALSCQTARLLLYLPGFTYNYMYYGPDGKSGVMVFVWNGNGIGWILFALIVGYVLCRILERRGCFRIEKHRWLWTILGMVVVMVICVVVFFILIDNKVLYFREVPFTVERDGYLELVFDEDWGNGRGATWNCGIEAYRSMDTVHKMVGVGPDCFSDYIYDKPELAQKLGDRFVNLRLTNAHNEQLTTLVNVGVLGWLCYMGIFVTAFVRCVRRGKRQLLLYPCAICILAYAIHNLVSFQQVLSTPYVFMILGIGEKLCRNTQEGTVDEDSGR